MAGAAALVSACTQITMIELGKHVINGVFSVTTGTSWNRYESNGIFNLTLDGPSLQMVVFFTNVAEGENIYRQEGSDSGPGKVYRDMPKFRNGMSAPEIGELLMAAFTKRGFLSTQQQLMRQQLVKPAKFGKHDGLRLDFTFSTKSGLDMKGIVQGAVVDDKLHLAVFSAPYLYYFGREEMHVEIMFNSITFAAKAAA